MLLLRSSRYSPFYSHVVRNFRTHHEPIKAMATRIIGINTVCQKRYVEKPMADHIVISANHFALELIARFSS